MKGAQKDWIGSIYGQHNPILLLQLICVIVLELQFGQGWFLDIASNRVPSLLRKNTLCKGQHVSRHVDIPQSQPRNNESANKQNMDVVDKPILQICAAKTMVEGIKIEHKPCYLSRRWWIGSENTAFPLWLVNFWPCFSTACNYNLQRYWVVYHNLAEFFRFKVSVMMILFVF